MIKKNGRPITGATSAMNSRAPVLTDANTSSAAQRIVKSPPAPFANPNNAQNTPAPVSRSVVNLGNLPASSLKGSKTGGYAISNAFSVHSSTETSDDMLAAVGEPRKPKGYNPIISGYPMRGSQRITGKPGTKTTRRG